jgi:hypothetical protein
MLVQPVDFLYPAPHKVALDGAADFCADGNAETIRSAAVSPAVYYNALCRGVLTFIIQPFKLMILFK